MPRSFDPTYRNQLLRYSRRVGWIVFFINLQGVIIALGIITIPLSILIWTQAGNLKKSGHYARELAQAEELPPSDQIIAMLITGYDYVGRFLWWYGFWFVIIICGFFISN